MLLTFIKVVMVAFGKVHYYYEDTKSNKSSMDQQSIIVDIIGVFFFIFMILLFKVFYMDSIFQIWTETNVLSITRCLVRLGAPDRVNPCFRKPILQGHFTK